MLTLFHDYTSPASAVAVARVDRLAREGVAADIVGFEAVGVDMHLPVTLDVLAQLDAVAEAAAAEGVELRRPPLLPPTGLAHAVEGALDVDLATAWRRACYTAFWRDGRDLADPPTLAAIAEEVDPHGAGPHRAGPRHGALRTLVERVTGDRLALAAVRRATAERRRDGVGGVPTILASRTLVPGLLDDDELRALAAL